MARKKKRPQASLESPLTHIPIERLLETQRSLEEALARYTDLFDSSPIGYASLNRAGLIQQMNLTAALILQVDRRRYAGMPFRAAVEPSDRAKFMEHLRLSQEGQGETVITELCLRARDGSSIPVQLHSHSWHSEKGELEHRTAIVNLSEHKRSEAARQELAAREQSARAINRNKDQFLAIVSHELRTPLTPLLAGIRLLEDEVTENGRNLLAVLRRNLDVETHLIDDLLDLSRLTVGKLKIQKEVLDLHSVATETLEALAPGAKAKGLQLEVELHAKEHYVNGDAGRLRQVLSNLVTNAIKFTGKNGKVTVRTSLSDGEGQVQSILMEVLDTGIGIRDEDMKRLFRPFEQGAASAAHQTGLGLGLTISHALVRAHGGRIWASSAGQGCGSTFSVLLPLVEPGEVYQKPPAPLAARATPAKAQLLILLVEDHGDTALLMSALLASEGHKVWIANSLAEARNLLASTPVDLVISDIGLPDGTGFDLMREINAQRPLPAIALSGFGMTEDIEQSQRAGFRAHLTKPVDFERLLETIRCLAG